MQRDRLNSGAAMATTTAAAANAPADHDTLARSRVIKTLQPGQPGTNRWQHAYGDRLVCVRYREDLQRRERHLTVELVLETRPLTRRHIAPTLAPAPRHNPEDEVSVRIGFTELQARDQAKQSGARWNPDTKLWEMPRHIAEELAWHHRIVQP